MVIERALILWVYFSHVLYARLEFSLGLLELGKGVCEVVQFLNRAARREVLSSIIYVVPHLFQLFPHICKLGDVEVPYTYWLWLCLGHWDESNVGMRVATIILASSSSIVISDVTLTDVL